MTHYSVKYKVEQMRASNYLTLGADVTAIAVLPFFRMYGMAARIRKSLASLPASCPQNGAIVPSTSQRLTEPIDFRRQCAEAVRGAHAREVLTTRDGYKFPPTVRRRQLMKAVDWVHALVVLTAWDKFKMLITWFGIVQECTLVMKGR